MGWLAHPFVASIPTTEAAPPFTIFKGGNFGGMRREMFAPSASSTSFSQNFYADVNPIRDSQIPQSRKERGKDGASSSW
jgi:hypothetical protein